MRTTARNRHRHRVLAALALLLAATGCLRRGPPPLEEVIVGEWQAETETRRLQINSDGTWEEASPDPLGSQQDLCQFQCGVWVLGSQSVFLRQFRPSGMSAPKTDKTDMRRSLVEFYRLEGGKLVWWDEDIGGSWARVPNSTVGRSRRALKAAAFDPVRQAAEARNIAGRWISTPNEWILDFGTNREWSTPNWGGAPWGKRGQFVVTTNREIFMQRQSLLNGEYLYAEGDRLMHVDWEGVTNIFHRLQTQTRAAHD